jgi:integrase
VAKVAFTAGRIAGLKCPAERAQAFLWDSTQPGLGLRVTPAGKPAFIFQSAYQSKTIRLTIGSPADWSITEAQAKAREFQRQLDDGRDPRAVRAERVAVDVSTRDAARRHEQSVSDAWSAYIAERKSMWSERTFRDHITLAQRGGVKRRRGDELTVPGPLSEFMPMRLRDLDADVVLAWVNREAKLRPARVRLAMRLLKAFLRWCAAEPAYKGAVNSEAASGKKAREKAGTSKPKADVLLREQLDAWFSAVRKINNPVIAAYLQCLLLTGARREELASLKWTDLNAQWKSLSIGDKVEGERMIPLTPYVAGLLAGLPRANEWVFSSARLVVSVRGNAGRWVNVSASGRLTEPSIQHRRACTAAGLSGLTLHGLRRSFKSLTEWLETPAGVVAQLMGHKPSATAEKHYTVRPLDLLRVHHEKIESWILEQAGLPLDRPAAPRGLSVVA